jgi:hypothetical protein
MANVGRMMNLGRGLVISNIEIGENLGEYPVYSSQTSDNGVMGYIDTYDFEGDYVTWTTDGANAGRVFFRTGKFLAIENYAVKPDIVALSKAIGGGLPMGVTLSSKEIMDWVPGSHANTMGGNLLACAAGIASLNYMRKKKLGANAKKIGDYMLKKLEEMKEKLRFLKERGV